MFTYSKIMVKVVFSFDFSGADDITTKMSKTSRNDPSLHYSQLCAQFYWSNYDCPMGFSEPTCFWNWPNRNQLDDFDYLSVMHFEYPFYIHLSKTCQHGAKKGK